VKGRRGRTGRRPEDESVSERDRVESANRHSRRSVMPRKSSASQTGRSSKRIGHIRGIIAVLVGFLFLWMLFLIIPVAEQTMAQLTMVAAFVGVLLVVRILAVAINSRFQPGRPGVPDDPAVESKASGGADLDPATADMRGPMSEPSAVPSPRRPVPAAPPDREPSRVELLSSDPLVRAATRRSTRHLREGRENEDFFGCRIQKGWAVLAVADGLGSSQSAHLASHEATETAIRIVVEQLTHQSATTMEPSAWRHIVNHAMHEAAAAVLQHWTGGAECMTTLVVAAVSRTTPRIVLVGGLGDSGVAIVRQSGGTLEWLSPGDRKTNHHVTSVTEALPPDAAKSYTDTAKLAPDDILFLASDGVTDAARPNPEAFANEIFRLMATDADPSEFRDLVDFEMTGPDDDRTIIAVNIFINGKEQRRS
jgi:serine/threonine protein phosphatase PrpC